MEFFMQNGNVKWFDTRKGFGFIVTLSGKEIYVHERNIQCRMGLQLLYEGDHVEFKLKKSPRGLHAVNVVRL